MTNPVELTIRQWDLVVQVLECHKYQSQASSATAYPDGANRKIVRTQITYILESIRGQLGNDVGKEPCPPATPRWWRSNC